MAKFSTSTLLIAGCVALVSLLFVTIFVVLQVTVNPRNHPVPFSVIVGGDRRINYPGDSCHNIELNTFTPNVPTVAYLTTVSSIVITKSLEQILANHSLQVGYDPNQLTYYGVPVSAAGDEVNLYIRASNDTPNIQSVTLSVYDMEGFRLLFTTTNADPIYSYNLDMSCLQSVSGCMINSVAELGGWLYFVFESTPTPSTLVVTLEATVRKYDLDLTETMGECTLHASSSSCFLKVPTRVIYRNDDNGVDYLPFTITYETSLLMSYAASSAQSLNTSVELSWSCSRTDLYSYTIIFSIASGVFVIAVGFVFFLFFSKCCKDNDFSFTCPSIRCPTYRRTRIRRLSFRTASTNIQLESSAQVPSDTDVLKSYVRSESLPPAYDKLARAEMEPEDDELPYYQHQK